MTLRLEENCQLFLRLHRKSWNKGRVSVCESAAVIHAALTELHRRNKKPAIKFSSVHPGVSLFSRSIKWNRRVKKPQRSPGVRSVWSCGSSLACCGAERPRPDPTRICSTEPPVNIVSCWRDGRIHSLVPDSGVGRTPSGFHPDSQRLQQPKRRQHFLKSGAKTSRKIIRFRKNPRPGRFRPRLPKSRRFKNNHSGLNGIFGLFQSGIDVCESSTRKTQV